MAKGIILLIIGVIVDYFIIRWGKKEEGTPFEKDWTLDEGVAPADETQADELLVKYGKKDSISLSEDFILSKSLKEFVELYTTLEFDDYTMDYSRNELLRGEETEKCWRGFYCIGGDGGEISFHVRRSADDEIIYAFDMEGSTLPEPYASNIRRFVVMRYNAWRAKRRTVN